MKEYQMSVSIIPINLLVFIIGNMLTKIIKQPDVDWAVYFYRKKVSKNVKLCLFCLFTFCLNML